VLPRVEQPTAPRNPAARLGRLALEQQSHGEPEGATHGTTGIAAREVCVVRPGRDLATLVLPTEEMSRRAEPLQVLGIERRLAISRQELGVRFSPRLESEGLAPPFERIRRGHGRCHKTFTR
jgi:hypothetical protein